MINSYENKIHSEPLFSRKWILSWMSIITGALLFSTAYVLFINPYNIVPGGVYGLGIILHNFFPNIQVGTFGLCFDIPLLLIAFKIFGAHFGARTIIAALLIPLLMNGLTMIVGADPETMLNGHINLSNDILLSAIFGGVISGAGLGLIFRTHATSGGTDIISMIITKYFHFPLSKSIVCVESVIVIIGLIAFGDWKLPLYSIITIFLCAKVIDYFIEGISNDKLLFIISEQHEKIKDYIMNDLSRGGTYIKSSGMYTDGEKQMIFLVISRRELSLVQSYIKEVDPFVFMVVVDAHETLGDGFKSFQDKLNS